MAEINEDNIRTILDNWDNVAINIYNDENNSRQVLESLLYILEKPGGFDSSIGEVLDSRHINTAEGKELDKIGEIGDISRKSGESDDKYRARIKAKLVSGNSSATFDDVVNFTSSILGIKTSELGIKNEFQDKAVAVVIGIASDAFEDTNLTEKEVLEILNTLVSAGHTTILNITSGTFKLKETVGLPEDQQVTAQQLKENGYKGLSNTESGGSYEGGTLVGIVTP